MSPDDPAAVDPVAALRRWARQEIAAGRDRVFVDPAVVQDVAQRVKMESVGAHTAAAARATEESAVSPAPKRAAAAAETETSAAPKVAPAKSPAKSAPKSAPASAKTADDATPLPRAVIRHDAEARARKQKALDQLNAKHVAVCTKCPLHETRTNTVFGVGNPDADVVFVGEAPGADEDAQGEPFVGRAGQLLTKILQAIGFEREDVYIANVLKCRPPNNRDPQPDEVAHCEPYLLKQLAIIEPKIVCALGRISAQTLLQTRDSLTKLRGRTLDYHGIPMVVTYHPAALLRNPAWKRPTWDDVRRLRNLYDELRAD